MAVEAKSKTRWMNVHMNSAARVSPSTTTSSDFQIRLAVPPYKLAQAIRLRQAVIPKTAYTVIAGVNDSLDNSEVPGQVVPAGVYDADTLSTTIQTLLNTAPSAGGFTVSVSATTWKMTIGRTGAACVIQFGSGAAAATSIAATVGFAAANVTVGGGGSASATGANVVQLGGPLEAFIVIPELSLDNLTCGGLSYTFWASMKGLSGDYVETVENSSYIQVTELPYHKSFATLSVQLRDKAGVMINLNGADWSMVIGFEVDT